MALRQALGLQNVTGYSGPVASAHLFPKADIGLQFTDGLDSKRYFKDK
jgi:hypothetical protein